MKLEGYLSKLCLKNTAFLLHDLLGKCSKDKPASNMSSVTTGSFEHIYYKNHTSKSTCNLVVQQPLWKVREIKPDCKIYALDINVWSSHSVELVFITNCSEHQNKTIAYSQEVLKIGLFEHCIYICVTAIQGFTK